MRYRYAMPPAQGSSYQQTWYRNSGSRKFVLVCCKEDDEASSSQEGSSGGRSHLVEQFTGVGIKVFLASCISTYLCCACSYNAVLVFLSAAEHLKYGGIFSSKYFIGYLQLSFHWWVNFENQSVVILCQWHNCSSVLLEPVSCMHIGPNCYGLSIGQVKQPAHLGAKDITL